jgi:hypothetical protein
MTGLDRTPAVVGVAVLRPYLLRLLFDDGAVRDLQYVPGEAIGPMLRPLDDPVYFALVRVDPEARTIVWPNGLDLAPEVLHGDYEPENPCGFHDATASRQSA